jgi:hypothetical protein
MTHDDHARPPSDGDLEPTVYARKGTLRFTQQMSTAKLQAALESFLSELTRALQEEGCRLIGHIKGIFERGDRGQLFFSVTSFEQSPRYKGRLTGHFEQIAFTLNVIVYGVASERIEELVLAGVRRHLGEVTEK